MWVCLLGMGGGGQCGWVGQETSDQVSPIPPERKDLITVAVAGNLQQANLG